MRDTSLAKHIAAFTSESTLGNYLLLAFEPCDDQLLCRDLSERLNLSHDEGEKWIVNLIRETRMGADAKIDLEKVCLLPTNVISLSEYTTQNVIEIHRSPLPVYQTVIEKTRGLAFRTQAMGAGMLHPQQPVQQNQSQPTVVEGAR